MDQRTRQWVWTILVVGVSLAWLLPIGGMAGTSNRFATSCSAANSRGLKRIEES